MHPGTDTAAPGAESNPGNDSNEGAAYALALLGRIGGGRSSADDLATVLQFLHSGSLLHGACVVIFAALLAALQPRATR